MTQFLLILAVALTVGAIGFGVAALVSGEDKLGPAEPDGRSLPLPAGRPLTEPDLGQVRFDTGLRGYRMDQVDAALHRAAYDIGYKDELVKVLQAEVDALREGRVPDADAYRRARQAALAPVLAGAATEADTGAVIDLDATADPPPADRVADPPPVDRAADPPAGGEPVVTAVVGPDPEEAERSGGPIAEEAGLPLQRTDPGAEESAEATEPAAPAGTEPAEAEPAGAESIEAEPTAPVGPEAAARPAVAEPEAGSAAAPEADPAAAEPTAEPAEGAEPAAAAEPAEGTEPASGPADPVEPAGPARDKPEVR